MRSGQYNNRKPKNAVGAGKRASGNEFNTSLKRERHPEPPQYPTSKVDERKQFSESRDARPKESGNRSQSSSSDSSSSRSNSSSSKSSRSNSGTNSMKQMQSAARTVVQNTVVMVAGTTTVLANTVMPELKTTISETFHIDLPTFAVVEEQSGENASDWLVEGDEAGIFEDAENESLEDDSDGDGDEGDDFDDSDSGDSEDSGADNDSEDAAPEDVAEQEPLAEPEQPEQPEEPEQQEEEAEPEEPVEEEQPEEPKEEEVPEVSEQPEQPVTPPAPDDSDDTPPAPSWSWSANNASATVWVPGTGSVPANVTTVEKPVTCTEDGSITYTATVTVDGQTYTDTRVEKTANATGHAFGAPQTVNGKTTYHCDGCNQDFVIEFGIVKE